MNKELLNKKLQLVKLQRQRLQASKKRYDIYKGLFPQQLAFLKDKSRRKAALCTRRAGKTYSVCRYLVETALQTNYDVLYLTTSGRHARGLMWRPLKKLLLDLGIEHKKNEQYMEIELYNGAIIYIGGAENEADIDKFRGFFFSLVVLDEVGSFRGHITKLIRLVILPTLEDVKGTLALVGTPNESCAGFFYDVTHPNGIYYGTYSQHQWSVTDNSEFPQWAGEDNWRDRAAIYLSQIMENDNYEPDDPKFLREWRARWIRSEESFVYQYSTKKNRFIILPDIDDWDYVLGVDFGFDDAFAIVVLAFHEHIGQVYCVDYFKQSGLSTGQWAEEIQRYSHKYKPVTIVADSGGLGKATIHELNMRHDLPVRAAEKRDKWGYIALMNDDFRKEKLFIRAGSAVEEELTELRKELKNNKFKELDGYDNHLCDALLYSWRECKHWIPSDTPGLSKSAPNYEELLMEQQQEQEAEMKEENFYDMI